MRTLLLAAAAIAAAAGSVCSDPESLSCLDWSTDGGNITFTATFNGFQGGIISWGGWGISEVKAAAATIAATKSKANTQLSSVAQIFCGNMFPAEMWLAYVVSDAYELSSIIAVLVQLFRAQNTDGRIIVEDRRAVGHVVPLCYDRQLSYQISGATSNGGKTLTASWTRPLAVPAAFSGLGYFNITSGVSVPLITALNYASPAVPAVPCTPELQGHDIAFSGLTGVLAGAAPAAGKSRVVNTTRTITAAATPSSDALRPTIGGSTHTGAGAVFSGVVGTFTLCSDSVTVLGQISPSGGVEYLGQGTGASDALINGFNTALDPTNRILYGFGVYEGAVETITLFGFSVDTGGAYGMYAKAT